LRKSSRALPLLRTQVEPSLKRTRRAWDCNPDSFGGLRALLVPADRKQAIFWQAAGAGIFFWNGTAGRWALARRQPPGSAAPRLEDRPAEPGRQTAPEAVEHMARNSFCAVMGVGLLASIGKREADWLPTLARSASTSTAAWRLAEEIRGGRFVAGFFGRAVWRFLKPSVILREDAADEGQWGAHLRISGADPLNLKRYP